MESAKGPQTSVPSGSGIGGASRPSEMTPVIDFKGTESFRIISKPQARYTDEARINNVEGKVRLKVVLLASGKLGNIWAVSNLPHGLTEQAVAAARNIKFQPKRVNGVPQSVTVTIDYNFNLY